MGFVLCPKQLQIVSAELETISEECYRRVKCSWNEPLVQHDAVWPAHPQEPVYSSKANIKATDHVLEVEPGTGNLTVHILEKAKQAVAVEMNPRMAAELVKRVQRTPEQRKLDIIIGDFVKADIPYFDVFAILMFQRLVAQSGTPLWSRLSANVQLYVKVDTVMHVPRNEFRLPPNVRKTGNGA
ncbi:hypothetical protein M422DRAFT_254032 [Sphaerobolus stellatus SS14]|uniref:rRNA adenine N(6)-methyltransferase n=1 Tax=Sphaerobolus stellatus (strain SS14) TaxID=990650 RepID=A0A0C9VX28_SPHS4|nr:hypothetical protein M422DRAFT_254032 [Sphaerobolus stellatus SS14]